MYEVDFTGWVRTPEELERLRTDRKYRRKLNWIRLSYCVRNRQWFKFKYLFFDFLFNKNNF